MHPLAVLLMAVLLWASSGGAQPAARAEAIRSVAERLPAVWEFVNELDRDVAAGRLRSNDDLVARARAFYTPARLSEIEQVVPGWRHMASFERGKTLWHVNVAMVALLQLDEYKAMSPVDRAVQEWIVLLHDLAKEPTKGRDHRHSFRSGARAGRLLPALGFPVTAAYAADFADWFELTDGAFRLDRRRAYAVQDNSELPDILAEASRLFEGRTLVAVKAITLHQSITTLAAWPVAAPLSRAEVTRYVDEPLYPALLALTLADSGGWNLFEPERLASMYRETRGAFARLRIGPARDPRP